ncbi:DUF2529 domain-containing protein [Bacillus sp. TH22]|uniref:DUF2529 domain-containing protein n=1 Tax=unclassified Bacillus (in: firmicutes) TaxID=185979 RepID=UPI0019143B63|nr:MULTISPECIES: DUF2529 domain-containing protein [unclassified Bacillus (in: firmicutes)]MBK5361597.1 DUF2529 domain-containing protein [Bacillus sp. TH44]MBK5348305.1 DUF2529 domain-containing protein [Bacillus sp. TH45]MBK5364797.1 DUF2529 domain-containing protein [Bacillus sp. TH50]MBK5450109.1 DUF2529 domain-containing protein [Bacillus sp. TH22]MBK5456143.1 DUF2529 domain-containing protein [Bacillus sp. TH23]
MLKIFSTQLSGYFSKISQKEEMNIEDSARLLAQALVGNGFIYLHGTNEMEGIVSEALFGAEPMKQAKRLIENGEPAAVTSADRVLLISRFSTDEEIIKTAKKLHEEGQSIVGISAIQEGVESLEQYTDVHIDTKLLKGLIPDDEGNRYGFPSLIIALFAYHGLKFTIDEMLNEY